MEHVDYMPLFMIVSGIMIIALCIVMFAVDEAMLSLEMKEYENAHRKRIWRRLTVNPGKRSFHRM